MLHSRLESCIDHNDEVELLGDDIKSMYSTYRSKPLSVYKVNNKNVSNIKDENIHELRDATKLILSSVR